MIKDTIYTIPLNEVLGKKQGCPICSLKNMLESRCIEYISGAAMMEPDVRIQTNKQGFCGEHYDLLLKQKNKLSVALMLETHLDHIMENYMPYPYKKNTAVPSDGCFVCSEINEALDKMISNMLHMFFKDIDFKEQLLSQEYFCHHHYDLLVKKANENLNKKQAKEFIDTITELTINYAKKLRENVHNFTLTFDYRNANTAINNENVKESVKNAVDFLK